MVYGLQLIRPFDLALHARTQYFSGDAKVRAREIKKLHEDLRKKIEKQNVKYREQANWKKKCLSLR